MSPLLSSRISEMRERGTVTVPHSTETPTKNGISSQNTISCEDLATTHQPLFLHLYISSIRSRMALLMAFTQPFFSLLFSTLKVKMMLTPSRTHAMENAWGYSFSDVCHVIAPQWILTRCVLVSQFEEGARASGEYFTIFRRALTQFKLLYNRASALNGTFHRRYARFT